MKRFSVWAKLTAEGGMKKLGDYAREGNAIRYAEKVFDLNAFHTVAVIDSETQTPIQVFHV